MRSLQLRLHAEVMTHCALRLAAFPSISGGNSVRVNGFSFGTWHIRDASRATGGSRLTKKFH
jgi:hypothetical protein